MSDAMTKKQHKAIQEIAKTQAIPLMLDQEMMKETFGVEMTNSEWREFCFHVWEVGDDEVWGDEDDSLVECFVRYAQRWLNRYQGGN